MAGMVMDMKKPWKALVLSVHQRQAGLASLVETATDAAIEQFGELKLLESPLIF